MHLLYPEEIPFEHALQVLYLFETQPLEGSEGELTSEGLKGQTRTSARSTFHCLTRPRHWTHCQVIHNLLAMLQVQCPPYVFQHVQRIPSVILRGTPSTADKSLIQWALPHELRIIANQEDNPDPWKQLCEYEPDADATLQEIQTCADKLNKPSAESTYAGQTRGLPIAFELQRS